MGAPEHVPALLLGRHSTVLARNALLGAVLGVALEPGSSVVRWLFLDPGARVRITNWSDVDVDRWWQDQRVTFRTSTTKRLAHPTAGPSSSGIESVVGPHAPSSGWSSTPSSPPRRRLGCCRCWRAGPSSTSRPPARGAVRPGAPTHPPDRTAPCGGARSVGSGR